MLTPSERAVAAHGDPRILLQRDPDGPLDDTVLAWGRVDGPVCPIMILPARGLSGRCAPPRQTGIYDLP